jgi:uncharacterized protein YjbI with pentapeptide repeats
MDPVRQSQRPDARGLRASLSFSARSATFGRMFVPRACAEKGCGRPALSGSDECVVHNGDTAGLLRGILEPRQGHPMLVDLDLAGVGLVDADLSSAEITGCRLTAATFLRVKFCGAQIQLSFLDRAVFTDCDFSGASILNSVFAGSELEGCSFLDCEIVQANFLGIHGVRTSFDHSNLYGSRFLASVLEGVTMKDCNLTRTGFDAGHRSTVDFRSSNTAEAAFQEPLS